MNLPQEATKPKKVLKSKVQELADQGINSYYVRFHQPVPPSKDKEPVSEFTLSSKQAKYVVEQILWTPQGVIWKCKDETNIVPLANVIYCRLTL